MNAFALVLAATFAAFAAPVASAHTQSYAFLTVSIDKDTVEGHLDLAARDLDLAYGLDADGDGRVTWGEFRAREAELVPTLLRRVAIGDADTPCALSGRPALIDRRGGETYLVLPFTGACPPPTEPIGIGYDLLFDVDAQHRALAAVTVAGRTQSFVLSPDNPRVALDADSTSGAGLFLTFVGHGAHHIWIGYDHILFLVTLLLGVVVTRRDGRWVPAESLGSALLAAVKVVTSFTLAHSLTLALVAFGVLRLPAALTESVIAATIVLAAFNNIVPVVTRKLWLVAFGFGLIHGVGFANVLADLELPRHGLLVALLAFNLGVELGQLAIVVAVLPILMLAGRRPAFGRVALPAISLAIAAIGVMWLVERATGVALVPIG